MRKKSSFNWSFDTLSDVGTDNAFLIRRVSDNVEQSFTYAEVINGIYATFISGSQGAIKEWYNGNNKLIQTTTTAQPFLVVNGGKPYIDDTLDISGLKGNNIVSSFSNDWVITAIVNKGSNANNQRLLYGVCGDTLYENFRLSIVSWKGLGYIKLNSNQTIVNSDISFPVGSSNDLNVYSFSKINGVFTVRKNNNELVLGSEAWSIYDYDYGITNSIRLGLRGNGPGEINKHQHLGIVYNNDLSGFDLSAHNNEIMIKYGIV